MRLGTINRTDYKPVNGDQTWWKIKLVENKVGGKWLISVVVELQADYKIM